MRILFVCLGNICRSPTAEGVFRSKIQQAGLTDSVLIDSAGTGGWHIGKAPDARTQRAALSRGYDLSSLRARQFGPDDFDRFDLILAMDHMNLEEIRRLAKPSSRAEMDLFLGRYDIGPGEVPDPYYGGEDGFSRVLAMIEQGADALLAEVRDRS
ncbi:low molecular weight protein-tyrosine-phosphatase [Pseudomonas matsuisoli]|nr:low molecular weight protein-tyrosine-phosphatase [Pseudomonas matsuisoli]